MVIYNSTERNEHPGLSSNALLDAGLVQFAARLTTVHVFPLTNRISHVLFNFANKILALVHDVVFDDPSKEIQLPNGCHEFLAVLIFKLYTVSATERIEEALRIALQRRLILQINVEVLVLLGHEEIVVLF